MRISERIIVRRDMMKDIALLNRHEHRRKTNRGEPGVDRSLTTHGVLYRE